jgi:hypothetical protein
VFDQRPLGVVGEPPAQVVLRELRVNDQLGENLLAGGLVGRELDPPDLAREECVLSVPRRVRPSTALRMSRIRQWAYLCVAIPLHTSSDF